MSRIDSLIAAMTLTEKLGQMTMATADSAVTGAVMRTGLDDGIKSGAIGNVLNLYGAERTRAAQRLAVENSRLGIPLLLGLDIIHGHRTLYPIPLGETAAFDPALWEATAREAAKEGAADGLHMTFAPMLDVARDPRWGRIAEGPGEDPFVGQVMARAKVKGFQGAGSGRRRYAGGLRQALLRLWRGASRPRLRGHRRVAPCLAGDLSAAIRGGGRGRRRHRHARLHID